jgi:hypothetical protein
MDTMTPEQRRARAGLAGMTRWHGSHNAEVAQARRELRESLLMDHIREAVAAAPPFTAEQRLRIAAILCNPAGGDHAAT